MVTGQSENETAPSQHHPQQQQLPRLGTQEGIMYLRSAESTDHSSGQQSDAMIFHGVHEPLSTMPSSNSGSTHPDSSRNALNFPGFGYVDSEGDIRANPPGILDPMLLLDDLVTPCQGLLPSHHRDAAGVNTKDWAVDSDPTQQFSFMLAHATHPMLKRGMMASTDSFSVGSNSEDYKPPFSRTRRETAPSGELANHFSCADYVRPPSGSAQTSDGGDSSMMSGSLYSSGIAGPGRATSAGSTSMHKKTQYHKTKLCPWHKENKCFMGKECNYAHTREELKPKPDLSKTKLCPEFTRNRQCDRPGCRFAHDFVELRATSTFFKTRICKYWQRGNCPAGNDCRHAHGREDLRVDLIASAAGAPVLASSTKINMNQSHSQSIMSSSLKSERLSDDESAPGYLDNPSARKLTCGESGIKSSAQNPSQARPPLQSSANAGPPLRRPSTSQNEINAKRTLFKDTNDQCIGPNASALPSPSFLSTTASTPLPQADLGIFLRNPRITECAEGLISGVHDSDQAHKQFVALIREEVDRQWRLKSSETSPGTSTWYIPAKTDEVEGSTDIDTSSFEESEFLPQFLVQKLKAVTPLARNRQSSCEQGDKTADSWATESPCGSPPPALIEAALGQLFAGGFMGGWPSPPDNSSATKTSGMP